MRPRLGGLAAVVGFTTKTVILSGVAKSNMPALSLSQKSAVVARVSGNRLNSRGLSRWEKGFNLELFQDEIHFNVYRNSNRLSVLHSGFEFILFDRVDCILIQSHSDAANDTDVERLAFLVHN